MKYINRVTINLSISKTVELWNDEQSKPQWQTGYVKSTLISGQRGEKGAVSEILLRYNGREMKLRETVLELDLPNSKSVLVEHEHMTNTMKSQFRAVGENTTEYVAEIEYIKFNKILPKLVSKLFPGVFKNQSQKWLDNFKSFSESTLD